MTVKFPDLSLAIEAEAARLGFSLVGITTPDPPPHYAVFESWLAAGRHGEMAYLSSERSQQRRQDPRQVLAECQAIIVVAAPYPNPAAAAPAEGDGPGGRVAAYAWGDDYHDILPARLEELAAFIERQVGHTFPYRIYTDSGPVLERDLAQRAGLGWIGKNTCLIHPRMGSYFLLAELLLGIELESDPPFLEDRCGSCTRCIQACPTGCILPDRTLDARRCISYLTIELKSAIPLDLRPALGEWVFGCDICQEVCPWNQRFAAPAEDSAFAPRPGAARPILAAALQEDAPSFQARTRGSPIRRSKRRGWLRNLAVAAGNSGSRTTIPALSYVLLYDIEPLARQHAAWALAKLGGSQSRQALQAAREVETDPAVLAEISQALETIS